MPAKSPTDRPTPDPTADRRARFLWGIPGTILTLSLIGAPLGLPMIWKASRAQQRLDARTPGPTGEPLGTVREILRMTLGGELSAGGPGLRGQRVSFDGGRDERPR